MYTSYAILRSKGKSVYTKSISISRNYVSVIKKSYIHIKTNVVNLIFLSLKNYADVPLHRNKKYGKVTKAIYSKAEGL